MDSMYESELVRLGLEAGRQIAGEGAFAHVSVEPGEDWTGQPSYYFEFVISDGYSLNRDHPPGFGYEIVNILRYSNITINK